jgi:hypothetical protein
MIESKFDPGISKMLNSAEFQLLQGQCFYWPESEVASAKHDAWFLYLCKDMNLDERKASYDAATTNKPQAVITAYWQVVERVRTEKGAGVIADFLDWFVRW